ncbi:DUF3347 domain-containing protein [Sphingobacterium gobiense]|uniref:DUF3347 domain-containing protein n=1 Tax=Sphingobacterium gobiense TaxID=1382456 RepID=A0A2S9JGD7_9SPHI|nr:DUF3347 domain-containing protein [Sphingobacterium gobiense]PRD52025.1 hypothetical protein C5749_17160 [Sphingobacterium gobiense]
MMILANKSYTKILKGLMVCVLFSLSGTLFAQEEAADTDFLQRERLLTTYFKAKDAYAEQDLPAFKAALTAFQSEIKILRLKGLVFEDMVRLKKVRDSLRISSAELLQADNIKEAKVSLSDMGSQMWALVEKMKFSETPVYLQYCPMEKAYWVSDEKTIFNPFSPVIMPACGSVVNSLSEVDYVTEACCLE